MPVFWPLAAKKVKNPQNSSKMFVQMPFFALSEVCKQIFQQYSHKASAVFQKRSQEALGHAVVK